MTGTTFDDTAPRFQFDVDFNALSVFEVGSDIPTADEIAAVMESANYDGFIQQYIWGQTEGPFLGTTEVAYETQN